ncbi:outer membrane protein [Zobellia alginiliquefaciens]|uniref:outer membrane protein n=1 Tax=Zobellia alginiliquefaciens TaxID=3032586 RepID=UPI0023E3E6A3|nr:OmpW family outer membrane protein [Zobellia alginiliquefaciens]
MRKFYFLTVSVFFLSVSVLAQDQKWSVEANYPLSVGDELGNDAPGIIDLGVKYRFLDLSIVKIGAGINAGVFKKNIDDQVSPTNTDFDETNWLIQPKVFAEFNIPALTKLHPSIGLGYSIIESKYEGLVSGESYKNTVSSGGLNVNLGLAYDITDRFFLQVQYDYISVKDTYEYDGTNVGVDYNLGYLKFGAGFRF